jgi:uncharacterized repeat protein (TIGR03803 family)
VFILLSTPAWSASPEVIHSFRNKNGVVPHAGLIPDASGNLYGTTAEGGAHNDGTVFQLTPKAGGRWAEKVLLNFDGTNGAIPLSGLISDGSGNLYGTASQGGDQSCSNGCGIVFELSPGKDGKWTEQVVHRFTSNGRDGTGPEAALLFDGAGNLYSTTASGGAVGVGTVFELTPASGSWNEQVLYSFQDGGRPYGSLVLDASGNLYGTTGYGGAQNDGTVFELSPKAGDHWREKVLHSFNGIDGRMPLAGLVFDDSGNLYATTAAGGTYDYGTVFELSPKSGGGWKENVLLSFNYLNGAGPASNLIFDAIGNLYGTTSGGGTGDCQYGCGTVFELSSQGIGTWTETLLVDFQWLAIPTANVILGSSGELYGTTTNGGAQGWGTVFDIMPALQ